MEEVKIYVANINEARPHFKDLYLAIPDYRKERAASYYDEDDKLRSIVSAYLFQTFVSKEEVSYNNFGKPSLKKGPFFNASHNTEYVVLAVSKREVGIDIQKIKDRDLSFLKDVIDMDISNFDRNNQHLFWAAKESMIKCIGKGLKDVMGAPAAPINGMKQFKGNDYYAYSFIHEGYAVSITLKNKEPFKIKEYKVEFKNQ